MCLSMVWYMTDVDEDSGGTYIVPGAHRKLADIDIHSGA